MVSSWMQANYIWVVAILGVIALPIANYMRDRRRGDVSAQDANAARMKQTNDEVWKLYNNLKTEVEEYKRDTDKRIEQMTYSFRRAFMAVSTDLAMNWQQYRKRDEPPRYDYDDYF